MSTTLLAPTRPAPPPPFVPSPEPARPRLYYGWVMLPISMAALIASCPGQTFGVSIFNEAMRQSLGLSHSQLGFAYTLGTILGAIPITFIGHMMDRHGLRRTMLIMVTLFSLACLFTAQAQGWLTLLIAFFLLRTLGPGALAFLSGNTLAFWFDKRLGMTEGLRQLGMAAAMAFVPGVNLWLVTTWGWRGAYTFFGLTIWSLLFPLCYFAFRNRPEDVGQKMEGTPDRGADEDLLEAEWHEPRPTGHWGMTVPEALRTSAFWIVSAGTAIYGLIHTAVFFSLVPIFQDRGLTDQDAAGLLVVFAICMAVMQLGGGMLADRVPAPWLLATGMLGLAISMALLNQVTSTSWAYVTGASMGAAHGFYFGGTHPLWARYFGRLHLGKIRGMLMTLIVASSSLGPLFVGLVRDISGSFDSALFVFALAPVPLALASLFVRAPCRDQALA
jgi:MFS transporter, OFA family, oxalate/formate antiporter